MGWSEGEGPWGKGGSDSKKSGGSGFFADFPESVEELVRLIQKRFRKIFPSGKNVSGVFAWIFAVLALLWLGTGVYRVQPNEQGVVLRFGEKVRIAQPGLNYHVPYPIETVLIKDVTAVNRIDSGSISVSQDDPDLSGLMLTGDENIANVNYTVLWVIRDIMIILFNYL